MSNLYIGQIIQGGWNFAPRGTAQCNGQIVSIAQNTALFSLLGTTFGGDGQTTFALPDLRSRTMMHWGNGAGLSQVQLGESSGAEQVTLLAAQMPTHTHAATFSGASSTLGANAATKATMQAPTNGAVLARTKDGATPGPALPLIYLPSGTATDVTLGGLNVAGTVTNAIAGGSQPVGIRNPYLGITHVIAMEGIYPSRS